MHTKGPWRWADHSARFGTLEDQRNMRTLEHNSTHPTTEGPVVRTRRDGAKRVLSLESRDEISEDDAELIRKAPELSAALHELLDMFGGNILSTDYVRLRKLAGER